MKQLYHIAVCSLLVLALTVVNGYAQKKNEINAYYGWVGSSGLFRLEKVYIDGAGSTSAKDAFFWGINYLYHFNKRYALRPGLEYGRYNVSVRAMPMGGETPPPEENFELQLLSIPLYGQVHFGNYFFINGGFSLDAELNWPDGYERDEQSGIGWGLGIGGQYWLSDFSLFVNPFIRQHALLPFNKSPYHQRLTQAGIKFGVGYRF